MVVAKKQINHLIFNKLIYCCPIRANHGSCRAAPENTPMRHNSEETIEIYLKEFDNSEVNVLNEKAETFKNTQN